MISETDIQRKEAELEQVITEYYKYDMSGLKGEIKRLLDSETEKLDAERRRKLEEISRKFTEISSLSATHIRQGNKHINKGFGDDAQGVDERFLEEYEKHSAQYED